MNNITKLALVVTACLSVVSATMAQDTGKQRMANQHNVVKRRAAVTHHAKAKHHAAVKHRAVVKHHARVTSKSKSGMKSKSKSGHGM